MAKALAAGIGRGLGVARISYDPWMQRVTPTAMADAATVLMNSGTVRQGTRVLN
ncbi:hypothetical protein ABIB48_003088 [Arthrobacter sp. UYCu511]|uniref:hypothetical protein n=1 Tax=Arthrobacter sp. UYCu511 TaxID=3156337 RepID=UPI0033973F61